MKFRCSVDAGMVGIFTKAWLIANGASEDIAITRLHCRSGKIKVKAWNTSEKKFELNSYDVYIGDPCYCFEGKTWDAVLNKTKYFDSNGGNDWVVLNTGGDGNFNVDITKTKTVYKIKMETGNTIMIARPEEIERIKE